jgi:hypothetical protein
MIRRGCTLIVALFALLFAAYLYFFTQYFDWPGNLIAAGFGALFGSTGLSAIGHLWWARRDTRAFARAARGTPPADGQLVVAAGPIRPQGLSLTSPFGRRPCVAYEYEVFSTHSGGRGRQSSRTVDMAGFAMAAPMIDTPQGGVRIFGFPLLDEFPQEMVVGAAAHARDYAQATRCDRAHGVAALRMFSEFDDAIEDADGIVRKDFRMKDDIPFESRKLGERTVGVGQMVCAVGRYDAAKRALVASGATINRLWPGTPEQVRRAIVGTSRSQAKVAFIFFAVSHAMLAGAFYLSETRHAREPEDRQATAIRIAVQDNDVAALERAVRRGANPNARDSFGDVVLLDVRDPDMAAALIRLGADVNARDRRDGATALIRAAQMNNAALVRVLLAAHASVHHETTNGTNALNEAVAGGYEEIAGLLRAAGAGRDADPVERPSVDVEPGRPR